MSEAISYGLISNDILSEDSFSNIDELRKIVNDNAMENYNVNLNGIRQLENKITLFESQLSDKYKNILKLSKVLDNIGKTIEIIEHGELKEVDESLKLTEWLVERILEDQEIFVNMVANDVSLEDITNSIEKYRKIKGHDKNQLQSLKEEKKLKDVELNDLVLDYNEQKAIFDQMKDKIENVKKENDFVKKKYMFLGKIKAEIDEYDRRVNSSDIQNRISQIKFEISQLKMCSETILKDRFRKANQKISESVIKIISTLDCDYKSSPISIEKNELSISILNGDSEKDRDFLFEIGSASNWLAYHISVLLSLHKYFLESNSTKVLPFIVFDQPSQVYFPEGIRKENEKNNNRSSDLEKVKMIFNTLNIYAEENDLQIIILEHAGTELWGLLNNFHTVEEWGNDLKLVPENW